MSEVEIAIVVSPRDWAERLHRFTADHGGARVRARVLDADEARREGYQVLVADDLTSFLTPRLLETLRRDGRRVLGVYDPVEPTGRDRLESLGVDDTISALAGPEEFVAAIDGLAVAAVTDLDDELRQLTGPGGRGGDGSSADEPSPRATIIAVGGPSGGPGATEVAIGVAAAIAGRGASVALVDADDVAPSVAQRLHLPLHPNLRAATDAVAHLDGDLESLLVPSGDLAVLPGLPRGRDWADLRPGEVVDVLAELAARHDCVVANIGHRLEDLTGPASGQGRHSLAQAVLACADRVLAVAAPTPVGVTRLLDWVAEGRAYANGTIEVVFNRVPDERYVWGQLESEVRRSCAPETISFVPEDPRVTQGAWSGEQVAPGAFTRAVERLAAELLPDLPASHTGGLLRRLRR